MTTVKFTRLNEEKVERLKGVEYWSKELTAGIKKDEEENVLHLDFSIFTKGSVEDTEQIKKKSVKSIEAEFPTLMKHPLVESYLYMKWSIVKKIFM